MTKKDLVRILKSRNVKICLLGNFVSTIGDCFNDVAILSFIFILYQSIDKLSWIYTVIYIAMFISSPLLGVICDRYKKKTILIIGSLAQGIVVFFIIVFPYFYIIIFCLFIETILAVLIRITLRSKIKESVSSEYILLTNSLSASINQVTRVISPALAGILLAFWSDDIILATRIVLGIDVISFFISTVSFMFLYPESPKTNEKLNTNFFDDIKIGWNALLRNNKIKSYYAYASMISVAGTLPFLLKIPLVMDNLSGDTVTLGLVNSFAAAGAVVGAIVSSFLLKDGNKQYFLLLRLLQGFSFLLMGLITKIEFCYALFLLQSLFQNTAKVSEESFVQLSIDKKYIGRVSSWYISANAIVVLTMLRVGVLISNLISIESIYIGVGIWNVLCFLLFFIIMKKQGSINISMQ